MNGIDEGSAYTRLASMFVWYGWVFLIVFRTYKSCFLFFCKICFEKLCPNTFQLKIKLHPKSGVSKRIGNLCPNTSLGTRQK